MALTHALATNNYGTAHLIVATSAANGTHTTLASAMADAVSGDTIFLRDSVTENVTLTAGVNIAAWTGGTLNTPSITGTLTMTTAGTCNISGIRLVTNSAALLAVTGSAASIVNLTECYLNCTTTTGISFTSSSASSAINITNCKGDLGTTGIDLFVNSSAGGMNITDSSFTNSAGSTHGSTTNTVTAGSLNISFSSILFPITLSSTSTCTFRKSVFSTTNQNVTALTLNGGASNLLFCSVGSGSASAISIGSSAAFLEFCEIGSTNTNAITGSGTINYSNLSFTNSSNTINTTNQIALISRYGINASTLQPAFLAYNSATDSNVTGDSTAYTVICDTEVYDQNSNYNNSTGVFTAPITGRYHICGTVQLLQVGAATTINLDFPASNRTVFTWGSGGANTLDASGNMIITGSFDVDMDSADTVSMVVTGTGTTKTLDVNGSSTLLTYFSGNLIC